jgi:hypothetical protein
MPDNKPDHQLWSEAKKAMESFLEFENMDGDARQRLIDAIINCWWQTENQTDANASMDFLVKIARRVDTVVERIIDSLARDEIEPTPERCEEAATFFPQDVFEDGGRDISGLFYAIFSCWEGALNDIPTMRRLMSLREVVAALPSDDAMDKFISYGEALTAT